MLYSGASACSCCRGPTACQQWRAQTERYHARPFADFCYMPGSSCNSAGKHIFAVPPLLHA